MDQHLLAQVVAYGDENAENACISQYLGKLEVICTDIAKRFNCDAEELLSEGYVHLVTTFRTLVLECRPVGDTDCQTTHDTAAIGDLEERLTAQLKLKLEQYVIQTTTPHKASIDAVIGSSQEPVDNSAANQHVTDAVATIPDHLINPFTNIANLCHTIGGSCYPPDTDDTEAYNTIIAKVSETYHLTLCEAAALLKSYEQYVETILNAHFNDQQQ